MQRRVRRRSEDIYLGIMVLCIMVSNANNRLRHALDSTQPTWRGSGHRAKKGKYTKEQKTSQLQTMSLDQALAVTQNAIIRIGIV